MATLVQDDFPVLQVQPPPAGLITDIIIPSPGSGDFPYDRLASDGSHYWGLDYVRADTTLAWPAVNVWYVQLTTYDFDKDEEFVFGPEHAFSANVPINGIQDFGDLIGPYGDLGEGFYIKCYLLNRVPHDPSDQAWKDPAVATFQCQKKVVVAVDGQVPGGGVPDVLPPLDVLIDSVQVRYQNGKAYVSVAYTPPAERMDRLHAYLYAPDTITDTPAAIEGPGSTHTGRWIIARNSGEASVAGKLVSSTGGPVDKGVYKHDANNPIINFEHIAPPQGTQEKWRVVLCSGYAVVPEKSIGESPYARFDVLWNSSLGTKGSEYGPNFRNGQGDWYEDNATLDAQMLPTWWFTLKWDNPVEDPRWDRVAGWQLWVKDPLKTVDIGTGVVHGFARVASLERNANTFVLTDRWNLTRKPVEVRLFLVPVDLDGYINTFVEGVGTVLGANEIARFTVVTTRGLQLQYADGSTIDGIDFQVNEETGLFEINNLDLTKVYGPSVTAEFQVKDNKFQWGENLDWKKFDPAKLGAPFDLNATTGFLDFPFNSAEFQTTLAGAKSFNIKALKESLFGNTEFQSVGGKIQIKGVDFTKALPGTFSPEFSQGAGNIFQVQKLSADKIKTGILEVGGVASGGERVSRFKVFDTSTTPQLIGWVGDDRDASGYVGAYFKRILIGGDDPADAVTNGIYADANGNITANCIFTGTLAAGVVYAGSVQASQITAGNLVAGVILTSQIAATQINAGTLAAGVIYAGDLSATQIKTGSLSVGGSGMAGQIFVYNASNALIGWIGTYSGWEGGWLKRLQLGGPDPANANIAIDAAGNVAIKNGTLTAPSITGSSIISSTMQSTNITGSTLVLNQNNITTSIQNQGGIAPVTGTFIGIRVQQNASPNWWSGMSMEGIGAFTPSQGWAILFSDALQVYDSAGNVKVRIGTDVRGGSAVGIWFNGVKVL